MKRLRKLQLYWNTLRYLKANQIWGRVRHRISHPRPDLAPPPALRALSSRCWVRPAEREPSLLGPRLFSFLNEAHEIATGDWNNQSLNKLWCYNLNYFDDLNALRAESRTAWHVDLLTDWVLHTEPGAGVSWEPYPLSLRVVNWIKWALGGNRLPDVCVAGLAVQVRYLLRCLETHLLGNHLFANAKALTFAGLFFEGAEARAWLELGMSLLAREVPEQVLADGGQFELSPMYHSLALEDMLDLLNLFGACDRDVPEKYAALIVSWRSLADRMRDWLATMCHPDGEIAFFNDAAIGIAPSPASLDAYATRLGLSSVAPRSQGLTRLEQSGYVRLAHGDLVALLDVARVGPDYLPGHAHADTLSFELSVGPQRVLVNSGTSCYGVSAERLRQRGTAAHNTVVVDGADSSEVWSGFRVARRAYPFGLAFSGAQSVECAHDGYRRLSGKPVHRRKWTALDSGFRVEDVVTGPCRRSVAYFHFHPDIAVESGSNGGRARLPDGGLFAWTVEQGQARLEPATWHPRFGEGRASNRLSIALEGGKSAIIFRWSSAEIALNAD